MTAPIFSAAKVNAGEVTALGLKPDAGVKVTAEDVTDQEKLARILSDIANDVSTLRARWCPRRIDFEDVVVDAAGTTFQLQHNFAGRVRWWVVGWQCATNATWILREDTTLTSVSTLALKSYVAGTVSIRVEESG